MKNPTPRSTWCLSGQWKLPYGCLSKSPGPSWSTKHAKADARIQVPACCGRVAAQSYHWGKKNSFNHLPSDSLIFWKTWMTSNHPIAIHPNKLRRSPTWMQVRPQMYMFGGVKSRATLHLLWWHECNHALMGPKETDFPQMVISFIGKRYIFLGEISDLPEISPSLSNYNVKFTKETLCLNSMSSTGCFMYENEIKIIGLHWEQTRSWHVRCVWSRKTS